MALSKVAFLPHSVAGFELPLHSTRSLDLHAACAKLLTEALKHLLRLQLKGPVFLSVTKTY